MTGELCDCFTTKREGVLAILEAVEAAAESAPILIWRTDGKFVGLAEARKSPLLCAAANWLALAIYAGRFALHGGGLLIDIGSTTTDIVPLWDGVPVPSARNDTDRLRCGELVYTGVRRTPVCALMGADGAAELFATTLDINLILGLIAENEADCDTADGRPATRAAALARLARMKCADVESITDVDLVHLARSVANKQRLDVQTALRAVRSRLPGDVARVVISGSGEFLAREALRNIVENSRVPVVSLTSEFGAKASEAACAYALMRIAEEMG
jgi:probable H4MPT-linked C1 transfer pathway protein